MRRKFSSLSLVGHFKQRLSHDNHTHDDLVKGSLSRGSSVYAGFDPTAERLHLGNLLQLVSLARASQFGLKPIYLIGGATGKIGDPSGKSTERALLEEEALLKNKASMRQNLEELVRNMARQVNSDAARYKDLPGPVLEGTFIDNLQFYQNLNVLEFLSDVGRHFRVNVLLSRESVASRLGTVATPGGVLPPGTEGLSYTEFSYQLLQAYDFLVLYNQHVDSTPEGKKFGKSEGNAVWTTSEPEHLLGIHQYLLNLPDQMLEPLLYRLTFLPQDTIHSAMLEQHRAPENNAAKLLLVREVLAYVTGSLEKADAVTNYKKYFSLDLDHIGRLTPDEAVALFKNVLGTVILPRSAVRKEMTAVELLKNLGLKPSINQANKLVEQSGLKINGKTVRMDSLALENYPALHDRIYILKYGKKDFMTVIIEG